MKIDERERLNAWAAEVLGGQASDYTFSKGYGSAILKQLIMQKISENWGSYEF